MRLQDYSSSNCREHDCSEHFCGKSGVLQQKEKNGRPSRWSSRRTRGRD